MGEGTVRIDTEALGAFFGLRVLSSELCTSDGTVQLVLRVAHPGIPAVATDEPLPDIILTVREDRLGWEILGQRRFPPNP
jgi:hypothetical protein